MGEESKDAEQAQYGRITILIQKRESGGFTLKFIDKVSDQTLATEYTLEMNREKAQELAVNRARDLLANLPTSR